MKEGRRSQRILASILVEIEWNGKWKRALTAVINLHGALILSPVDLPAGSELKLKNPQTGLQAQGRVVWCGTKGPTGSYKLGVEFEDASATFWGVHYDPQVAEAALKVT